MTIINFARIEEYDSDIFKNKMDILTNNFFNSNDFADKTVLLKPNLLIGEPPEKAVTTHPSMVEYFVVRLKKLGAKIIIGDSPAVHNAVKVAEICGIKEIADKYNIPLINFQKECEISRDNPFSHKKLLLAEEVKKADYIINIAKVKTHGQMTLTLSVKNLFGCIAGLKKAGWHLQAGKDHEKFASMILSVSQIVNADFHVLDGILSMEGNGPRGGTPRKTGFVAASTNPYALDLFTAGLLGFNVKDVPTLALADKMKLEGTDFSSLEFKGDDPGGFKIDNFKSARPSNLTFNLPPWLKELLENMFTPFPEIIHKECKKCMLCKEICAAKAIDEKNNKIVIDYKKCIHCFCCQEVCPFEAIKIKTSMLSRIYNKIRKK